MSEEGAVGSPSLKSTSPPRSSSTFGHQSDSLHTPSSDKGHAPNGIPAVPIVNVNGSPHFSPRVPRTAKSQAPMQEGDEATWGSNFWVTLIDPQVSGALRMQYLTH
jgi:hypothetical protein